jgi:hypothetical protein
MRAHPQLTQLYYVVVLIKMLSLLQCQGSLSLLELENQLETAALAL